MTDRDIRRAAYARAHRHYQRRLARYEREFLRLRREFDAHWMISLDDVDRDLSEMFSRMLPGIWFVIPNPATDRSCAIRLLNKQWDFYEGLYREFLFRVQHLEKCRQSRQAAWLLEEAVERSKVNSVDRYARLTGDESASEQSPHTNEPGAPSNEQ